MKKIKISVVTPCYNSTPFLRRIHASLARQTYDHFEWLTIDDKSTDATVEMLLSLPDPGSAGMKVFALPQNSGGGVATGFGVEQATGDILLIVDHDDELEDFAFQVIVDAWKSLADRPEILGLFYRRSDPATGATIGGELTEGFEFSMSWLTNHRPDISDGVIPMRLSVAFDYFNVRALESICLLGVPLTLMTKGGNFMAGSPRPLLKYHRDNPDSQTNAVKISRKTVFTYAKYIDAWDRHYFLQAFRWLRHLVATIKFSIRVHGVAWYHHRFLQSPSIRALSWMLMPLGFVWNRFAKPNQVVIFPEYDFEKIRGLKNIRADFPVDS